jgi:hypothetical protein
MYTVKAAKMRIFKLLQELSRRGSGFNLYSKLYKGADFLKVLDSKVLIGGIKQNPLTSNLERA